MSWDSQLGSIRSRWGGTHDLALVTSRSAHGTLTKQIHRSSLYWLETYLVVGTTWVLSRSKLPAALSMLQEVAPWPCARRLRVALFTLLLVLPIVILHT